MSLSHVKAVPRKTKGRLEEASWRVMATYDYDDDYYHC